MPPLHLLDSKTRRRISTLEPRELTVEELRVRRMLDGAHVTYRRGCTILRLEAQPGVHRVYRGRYKAGTLFFNRARMSELGSVRSYGHYGRTYWRIDMHGTILDEYPTFASALDTLITLTTPRKEPSDD